MKNHTTKSLANGFTLIELSIVIGVMILLASGIFFGASAYRTWQQGLDAGETLKKVYSAQKLHLAENPTKSVSSIEATDVIAHMPDGATQLPVVKGEDGETLTIDVSVSPPVYMNGEDVYDPSGNNGDNLWDTGK